MLSGRDLHKSLKSEILVKANIANVELAKVKLAWGKDDIAFGLHVAPRSHSFNGLQITDLLNYIGFSRQDCLFLQHSECYVREVVENLDINAFGTALALAYQELSAAQRHLECCAFRLPQPEGWGYFNGKHSRGREVRSQRGDGHTSTVTPKRMKEAEDDVFKFVFSWIKNRENDKGWTIHYRPKHPPLSVELQRAFRFLGINDFQQCPEFDFEPCGWRYYEFQELRDSFSESNAEDAHKCFDSHPQHFSPGIKALLAAQATMEKVGMGFLPSIEQPKTRQIQTIAPVTTSKTGPSVSKPKEDTNYDVAISFAGSERHLAEELATRVQAAGFNVFYDKFFDEELWGKNLAEFFHEIYSKKSRYCVIFVSNAYLSSEWTIHERRSAQERMLKEKGNEYILPIKVDEVELPGMPTTMGYLNIMKGIDKIAEALINKLTKK